METKMELNGSKYISSGFGKMVDFMPSVWGKANHPEVKISSDLRINIFPKKHCINTFRILSNMKSSYLNIWLTFLSKCRYLGPGLCWDQFSLQLVVGSNCSSYQHVLVHGAGRQAAICIECDNSGFKQKLCPWLAWSSLLSDGFAQFLPGIYKAKENSCRIKCFR